MISVANLALVAILAFGLAYYFLSKRKQNVPPGPWNWPLIGGILSIGATPHLTFQKWGKKYGPLIRVKMGLDEAIIIDDPKLIREAFNEHVFNGRFVLKFFEVTANGNYGISNAEGHAWSEQRRFVLRKLRDFGFGKHSLESFIMAEVQEFMKWMKEREGLPTAVDHRFTLATVNALWTLIAGERQDQDDPIINEIIRRANDAFGEFNQSNNLIMLYPKLTDILPKMLIPKWHQFLESINALNEIFKDAVDEHIENPADEGSPRDLIDVYLTEIKKTKDSTSTFFGDTGRKSLDAVISDLYGAGQGTISVTLTWTILYLVRFPEVQKKLQRELDAVIGQNRPPSLTDKPQLPYTEALTQEVLRYSSIAPTAILHATLEDTVFHDYHIKKGTMIIPNLYSVHHSTEIWGDPEAFRPERFLTEDGQRVLKSENLLAFGTGKRACLGEALARDIYFLFLTSIFQRFEIVADPKNPRPSIEPKPGFFLEAQKFEVIFKDRID